MKIAIFTIDVSTNKAESGVASLAGEVGSLSKEFDALQASLGAAEGKLADFSALQQKNLAYHDSQVNKNVPEPFDWKAAQQKALAGHDANRDAAAGLQKQQEAAAQTRKEFEQLTASGDATEETLAALKEEFGMVADAALAAVIAIVAVTAAIAALAVEAIRLAQEKDALAATFGVLTGEGSAAGRALIDDLGDMAADMPFVGGQLEQWAKSLLSAGIQGDALKTSIKAVAAATAIMGESGGQAALGLIKRFQLMADTGQKIKLDRRILGQMAEAGISAKALAAALGVPVEKLGEMQLNAKDVGAAMQKALIQQGAEPMKLMGNTWASITAKLKDSWESLFEDLGPAAEPLMAEIRSFAAEFFDNSVAAGGMRQIVVSAFTAMFKVAKDVVNIAHTLFLYIEIGALKARIALAPLTSALGNAGVGMFLLKWAVLAVVVIVGLLAAAVFMAVLPFLLIGAAIVAVVAALIWVGLTIATFVSDAISHFDDMASWASQAGQNMIDGLGNAISNGAAWVVGLAKKLASDVIGGITSVLQIKSPSRVMMRIGAYTTRGMAEGIERGTGDVEEASRGAAQAAIDGVAGAPGRAGANGAGGGRKVEVRVEAGAIVINGAGGDVMALTEEALARLFELVVARAGLVPVGA